MDNPIEIRIKIPGNPTCVWLLPHGIDFKLETEGLEVAVLRSLEAATALQAHKMGYNYQPQLVMQ